MEENLTVLIIDDEILVHIGLKSIISSNWENVKFLSEYTHEKSLFKKPDLVIYGKISSVKTKAMSQIKELRKEFPFSAILILTHFEKTNCVIPYLKSGANGYLTKSTNETEIISAIKSVLERKCFFCRDSIREKLFDHFWELYCKE